MVARKPVPVTCAECGAEFISAPWRVARGIDRYCSKECRWALNAYRVDGDAAYITLTTQKREFVAEAAIDREDLESVRGTGSRLTPAWSESMQSYYTDVHLPEGMMRLHRWLLGVVGNMQVDHRSGDTLDNRKANLRPATNAQNLQNRRGLNSNSTSGIRGVYWEGERQRWVAHVKLNGRHVLYKRFKNKEDAESAAIEARKQYFPYSSD